MAGGWAGHGGSALPAPAEHRPCWRGPRLRPTRPSGELRAGMEARGWDRVCPGPLSGAGTLNAGECEGMGKSQRSPAELHSLPRAASAALDQALHHPRVFPWLGLNASGTSSFHPLPPSPSGMARGWGAAAMPNAPGICGFGSREQSEHRRAKGDVGKGALGEEEEDNANSLLLREAAFRCKVLCHGRCRCCHSSRACQGWQSLLSPC